MFNLPLILPSGFNIKGESGVVYSIDGPIRPGASGVVYRARLVTDESVQLPCAASLLTTSSLVAIKFFLPVFLHVDDLFRAEGSERLKRLQEWHERELSCLRSIDHPNIVSVLDNGVFFPSEEQIRPDLRPYNSVSFLVTRFIDGENLSERMSTCIDTSDLVDILKNVCDGLIYLHESRKYLHADIRAENIVVERNTNRAVIVDFALFKNFNFDEIPADGITRLTADQRTLPADVPIKDEGSVHGRRDS